MLKRGFNTEYACRGNLILMTRIVAILLQFSRHLTLNIGIWIHGDSSMRRHYTTFGCITRNYKKRSLNTEYASRITLIHLTRIVAILLHFSRHLTLNIFIWIHGINQCVDIRRHSVFIPDINTKNKFNTEYACRGNLILMTRIVAI